MHLKNLTREIILNELMQRLCHLNNIYKVDINNR